MLLKMDSFNHSNTNIEIAAEHLEEKKARQERPLSHWVKTTAAFSGYFSVKATTFCIKTSISVRSDWGDRDFRADGAGETFGSLKSLAFIAKHQVHSD